MKRFALFIKQKPSPWLKSPSSHLTSSLSISKSPESQRSLIQAEPAPPSLTFHDQKLALLRQPQFRQRSLPPQEAQKNPQSQRPINSDGVGSTSELDGSRRALRSALLLISGVTPDNAQTVIDYIRQLTNINFIDTCLMFQPGHKALIVCINDARDAQFINQTTLQAALNDTFSVERIYNDTGKLDRNYFLLIQSWKNRNSQAPIYERAEGSGSEAEQSEEDLGYKAQHSVSLSPSPVRKRINAPGLQARINSLKGVATKTPRGVQIHPKDGALMSHSQSMNSLEYGSFYQNTFTPPPLHPHTRVIHRSSSGLDGSHEIGSPMNLARMSPSLAKMSPQPQISPGISDFFNSKAMSQTQPFFPRGGSYSQSQVIYPAMGNLSTQGSYSGPSTPSLHMNNTMGRLVGHFHTHSASSSSAFDIDCLNNSGRFSNSSGSSNHRQPGHILASTMIHPPMGKTPPRPRLTHARSFQLTQSPLDMPGMGSLENTRGKSPRKQKKKKNKKTKSHGDKLLTEFFPSLGKSEQQQDEREDKEETKRVLLETELQIDISKVRESKNTTIMFKNIPSKITKEKMKEILALKGFKQEETDSPVESGIFTYDYLRLPLDKVSEWLNQIKKKSNRGFAFINLTSSQGVMAFYDKFQGMQWSEFDFNTDKVKSRFNQIVELRFAKYQGKEANEKAQDVENVVLQRVEM